MFSHRPRAAARTTHVPRILETGMKGLDEKKLAGDEARRMEPGAAVKSSSGAGQPGRRRRKSQTDLGTSDEIRRDL